jgi:hypothetical protein
MPTLLCVSVEENDFTYLKRNHPPNRNFNCCEAHAMMIQRRVHDNSKDIDEGDGVNNFNQLYLQDIATLYQ